MKNHELPAKWLWTEVGSITDIVRGASPRPKGDPRYFGGAIPWIKISDITRHPGKFIYETKEHVTPAGAKCSRLLSAGSLILSNSGTVCVPKILAVDGCIHDGFLTFPDLSESVSVDFAYWWFEYIRPQVINEHRQGNTQVNLNTEIASGFPFPIAPLNEQHRIVAKLEKLLSRVAAAQARLITVTKIFKSFRKSVLSAACSGRLTVDWRDEHSEVEPATSSIEKLRLTLRGAKVRRGVPESVQLSEQVADWDMPQTWGSYSAAELLRCGAFIDLKDGNHGANHPKVSEFTKTGLPFITAAQVNDYSIDYDGAYKLSGEPLDRIRVGFAKSSDVIYTHKGSVGRVALADRDCILTPQTTYYRVNPKVWSNRFLMYYLASHPFSEQVDVVKEQTTRDFVPISEQYLLFHRVPPLTEQQEIVRRVEALFKTADALEARYRTAKAHVEKLTQSILAKAFRGELVPQDPNDEPAPLLLERIRQQRNGPEFKRKGRRK